MSEVKMKAVLPKDDEANGLSGSKWADFFNNESKPLVALVVLQSDDFSGKKSTHTIVPKVEITRIEPVTDDAEANDLLERMRVLGEERTGVTRLDIPEPPRLPAGSVLDFDGPDAA